LVGIYFSGTGNTKHCVEEFVGDFDDNAEIVSLENIKAIALLKADDFIVLGYPVYFSNMPKIVRDFIVENKNSFRDKKVMIIATMALFSGDGAGCSARILKKHGAKVIGGLHVKMPDCIGDEKMLKKSYSANRKLIEQADVKIALSAERLKNGNPTREGLNIFHRIAGLLVQRLWFYWKTATYKDLPKIAVDKCTGCGQCAKLCPTKNIYMTDKRALSKGKCTMCYRCFSNCPTKAITILGKNIYEQYRFENCQ